MGEHAEREIARGLREGSAESWRSLYDAFALRVWNGVARRVGRRAADARRRDADRSRPLADFPAPPIAPRCPDLVRVLDEELGRLPEVERVASTLGDLTADQGAEAADLARLSVGLRVLRGLLT